MAENQIPVFRSSTRSSIIRTILDVTGAFWIIVSAVSFLVAIVSMSPFAFLAVFGGGTMTVFCASLRHICTMLEEFPQSRDENAGRIYIKPRMPDLRKVPRKTSGMVNDSDTSKQ